MNSIFNAALRRWLITVSGVAALSVCVNLHAQTAEKMHTDPAALSLPLADSCRDCHAAEYAVWQQTRHASGFTALHRTPLARTIADAMGESLIKRDSLCLRCHYTPVLVDGKAGEAGSGSRSGTDELRAGAGVSCQSCHGEAREWLSVHYDFGVDGAGLADARAREGEQHRVQRQAQAAQAGMVTGSNLIAMASACMGCHLVADEQLLDRSRHPAGNPNFEFATWADSRIRHRFLDATVAGSEPAHVPWSAERRRMAYVIGRLVQLEYALRALAEARRFGRHTRVYLDRVEMALQHLERIADVANVAAAREALAATRNLDLVPDRGLPLRRAADQVNAIALTFERTNTGSALGLIDPMLDDVANLLPLSSRPCEEAVCAPVPLSEPAPPPADGTTPAAADTGDDAVAEAPAPANAAPVSITPLVVPRNDATR